MKRKNSPCIEFAVYVYSARTSDSGRMVKTAGVEVVISQKEKRSRDAVVEAKMTRLGNGNQSNLLLKQP